MRSVPPPVPPPPALSPLPAEPREDWTDDPDPSLDTAQLIALGERRAVLEDQLAREGQSARLRAAQRKLEADFATERQRLADEAAARNLSRDDQRRAEHRAQLDKWADEVTTSKPAKPGEVAPTTPKPLPEHYKAAPNSLLLGILWRAVSWLLAILVTLTLVAFMFGTDLVTRIVSVTIEAMGYSVGILMGGGPP